MKADELNPLLELTAIANLERQAANLREKWLQARGWEKTCNTPGAYWMWERSWGSITYVVDTDTAARMQQHWDHESDCKLHPENYKD